MSTNTNPTPNGPDSLQAALLRVLEIAERTNKSRLGTLRAMRKTKASYRHDAEMKDEEKIVRANATAINLVRKYILPGLPLAIKSLGHVTVDCDMALCGAWDKSDDGFDAMQDHAADALHAFGIEPPEYEPEPEEEDEQAD